ncbi:MAG: hypothetical protein ACFFC7_20710 [Candidatus Hermodarchaeota archaeon]
MSEAKKYFDTRKVDEKTQEKAKGVLNVPTIQKLLSRIRAGPVGPVEVAETEARAFLKWLEDLSKIIPITDEPTIRDLLNQMTELGYLRTRLDELYDVKGLDVMKKVRESMIQYYTVVAETRRLRDEFVDYYFWDKAMLTEIGHVLLNSGLENKIERLGFTQITCGDFLNLLKLELACADSASKLEQPMLILKPNPNDPSSYLMIPTEAALEKYNEDIDKIHKGKEVLAAWLQTIKPVDIQGYLKK